MLGQTDEDRVWAPVSLTFVSILYIFKDPIGASFVQPPPVGVHPRKLLS